MAILNIQDKETQRLANGIRSRKLPSDIQERAMRFLRTMAECEHWNELRNPPGNRLHALHGDREGQYALRINKQWRIAFTPVDGACANVEVTDYHH